MGSDLLKELMYVEPFSIKKNRLLSRFFLHALKN
ncbi:hypothetical protein DFP79_3328 [Marinomonas balearica]|uniref:Uncharacterized protein n=1 Tax=Marinomonas balearica TaxID=491947 RepID=A0A4R6M5W8_9GAMM|nr:hypothetical protein DFP79_3328 [Marinomonas balearica]